MTDQPKWMPTWREIDDAWREEIMPVGSRWEAIRALIRAAVEKALAEQMDLLANSGRLCPADGLTYEGLLLKLETREARHKREVIEARIALVDKWALCICPFTGGSRFDGSDSECPGCRDLNEARAELAALEVKP